MAMNNSTEQACNHDGAFLKHNYSYSDCNRVGGGGGGGTLLIFNQLHECFYIGLQYSHKYLKFNFKSIWDITICHNCQ